MPRARPQPKQEAAASAAPDLPVGSPRSTSGRRAEILRQAANLFDQSGYHQTSMQEIADAVGIRKPSLYHYFASKDELLFWIHEVFVDRLLEQHAARLELPLTMSQHLHEVIADILTLMETHRGHVRVFFEHYRELGEPYKTPIKEKRDRYHALVEDIVRRGVDGGEFRPVDVPLTTLAVFGCVNWAYQWYESDGRLRPREVAYVFSELILNGLAAAAPAKRRRDRPPRRVAEAAR